MFTVLPGVQGQDHPSLFGFTGRRARWQREYEQRLLGSISADRCRQHLRRLTSVPHLAGTPENQRIARHLAEEYRRAGWRVQTVQYDVLLSYPKEIKLELVAPERLALLHPEDPLPEDPHSRLDDELYRVSWTAYSPSVDLTAPVVYANFGRPEDYDELARRGIDVRGKVVLVRYFQGYRASKTQEAERRGVAALIIYCDPAEDGETKGAVFPQGPWGPPSHFQRGANVYDFLVPGDPLTPGWASVSGARRIRPKDAKILPRLAMIPISARSAGQLMERLGGVPAPAEWQGGMRVVYRLGDGSARVRFLNRVTRERRRIQNVLARLVGTEEPQKIVLLSNHYDAWVYGAVDPSSGTAAMLELARALGKLRAEGWRPRRTLLLANWDAEEFTLTGSTEWGEQHADSLRRNLIACLNVDTGVSGTQLVIGATPSLDRVLAEVARVVPDPQTQQSLYDRWTAQKPEVAPGSYATLSGTPRALNARILGSGSDYTVFFNHLGVPSADLSFEGPYGVYHSVYDGFVWMDRFGDPGFHYHAAMATFWGVLALRLANADVLPLDFVPYARELRAYVQDVSHHYPADRRDRDLRPILEQVDEFERAAQTVSALAEKLVIEGNPKKLARLNRAFQRFEQTLSTPQGLPGRPWFRHLIYAPLPTYAAETLPGIREAVVAGDWPRASAQARVLLEALRRATELLKRTASVEKTGNEKVIEYLFSASGSVLASRLVTGRAGHGIPTLPGKAILLPRG